MFSSGSSRKPLLRSNSERPAMRNLPLFGFLFGLVFFFYIFYVYQAQSTESALLREQLDSQIILVKNLKNELIDVKADVERLRTSENAVRLDRDVVKTNYDECFKSLRTSGLKSEAVQFEKTKIEETLREKESIFEEAKKNTDILQRNLTAVQSLLSTQQTLCNQLNETVVLLQREVATLKSSSGSVAQASNDAAIEGAPPRSLAQLTEIETMGHEQAHASMHVDDLAASITTSTKADPVQPSAIVDNPLVKHEDDVAQSDQDVNAIPQIAVPRGPGERLRMEEEREKIDNKFDQKPVVQGGDYDEREEPVRPAEPELNAGNQPAPQ